MEETTAETDEVNGTPHQNYYQERCRVLEEEARVLRESNRLLDKLARRLQRRILELEDRLAARLCGEGE